MRNIYLFCSLYILSCQACYSQKDTAKYFSLGAKISAVENILKGLDYGGPLWNSFTGAISIDYNNFVNIYGGTGMFKSISYDEPTRYYNGLALGGNLKLKLSRYFSIILPQIDYIYYHTTVEYTGHSPVSIPDKLILVEQTSYSIGCNVVIGNFEIFNTIGGNKSEVSPIGFGLSSKLGINRLSMGIGYKFYKVKMN